LENKYDVFDTFKKWKAKVKNETWLKVKYLRLDNGGEYGDHRFKEFCVNRIKMEKTIPVPPQHNSVAEWMNITLNEGARSMRIHARLSKMFWADAVNMLHT